MSWINDRLIERKQMQERKELIFQQAENVFRALWTHIEAFVREAKEKGEKVGSNGSSLERRAYLDVMPRGKNQSERKELSVSLDRTAEKITAKVRGSKIDKLEIDIVGDGDTVGLKYKGQEIDEQEAAILLFDAFLFWDLPMRELPITPKAMSREMEEAMRRMEHDEEP